MTNEITNRGSSALRASSLRASAPSYTAALTTSQLFDRKGANKWAIGSIFLLSAVLAGAVAWSSVMPVAEISVSSGEVVPSGAVQQVQHLEGGIVANVLVHEGDKVAKGDLLVEMAPDIAAPELAQLRTRRTALRIRIGLLTDTLEGRAPQVGDVDNAYQEIARVESRALAAKRDSIESQSSVLAQQVRERKAELATLLGGANALEEQIALTKVRIEARRKLVEKGLFSRLQLIDDERDLSRLTGERSALDMDAMRIQERIREATTRITELNAGFQSDIAIEISSLTNEAAELQLAIDRAMDRVERLAVIAPVSGRVLDLQVKTIGGVIAPGATLMNIVPEGAQPYVEARISPSDVGFVHAGQSANIKVMTYDYARHGAIKGKVAQISPSTFTDDDGNPYYKAQIDLESAFVGGDENKPVSPGMTVIADIVSGEKTLLAYLMSPVTRSFDTAMRER
ncbi:HlyD family type I secretion periplasmic adaptor subunit [Pikeienuella piscinae]|uniref:Membrane fusion protein (MFP) family protein n=1 Tax=Pikeienuella piscinae TaxID=2748098 RepID=A0A7L5C431_9RHOB|nr:HlyD family type I secretion periplasmic adaptor subunit [Pikeienuella piscinae]QIE56689.1 HlyD family type I secretion periplasmic adaptor subunit [Pikeienuella piscinae]